MTQYSGKVIRKTPVTPTQTSASGVWKLNEQAAAIRNNSWPVPGVPDPISRSVRLRSSASAYFSRTPAVAGNQKTWTMSFWVKRGQLGVQQDLYSPYYGGDGANESQMYFKSDDTFAIYDSGANAGYMYYVTTQVFRDPSAWYHFVVACDTTQATAANRLKIYVNGVQITSFSTAQTQNQNTNTGYNGTSLQRIGMYARSISSPFDGYLTEFNNIDGQQLTPSSFGTTDTATGAWIPMPYTGTYGTNGFYLNFKDNTSTTTIGYDYSGNANNWTANNISLTAGSTYDSMLDVPTPWVGYSTTTDTSAVVRGNYAVMNPLDKLDGSITGGNLDVTTGTVGGSNCRATMAMSSGKWYWEMTPTSNGGIADLGISIYPGSDVKQGTLYTYQADTGNKYSTAGGAVAFGATYTTNDIIGIAYDATNGKIWWAKNGTWQASGDPANDANAAFTGITGDAYAYISDRNVGGTCVVSANFGQRPFTYTPPTGFKTLVTTNLPTPTITNGANYMAATIYTGTGGNQTISNAVNGVSFQPDLAWLKDRSASGNHQLFNSIVGAGTALASNLGNAEFGSGGLNAFNSNGFSGNVGSTDNYVSWQWKAGGTSSSNTSGSITSTVSVNTTAGFSVVTFTGNNSTGTVGHGLGVAPSMIIQKPRNSTGSWAVYHASLGAGNAVWLNLTDASASYPTVWNSTAPTSSVYSVGSYMGTSNYVAYCWAAVAGYSAFGSYTGNGSTDGTFVYCGFRPRFILAKCTNAVGNWSMIDTSRDPYNLAGLGLDANNSNAEYSPQSSGYPVDILSNGFKWRTTSQPNTSGQTYIFAAFAEVPFKFANSR